MSRRGRPAKLTGEVLAAIPIWRELGLSVDQIAEMLEVTSGSLEFACQKAGVSTRIQTNDGLRRALTSAQWARLTKEAAARRVPVMQLVADLVGAIADSDIFDAVIDADNAADQRETQTCSVQS